MLVSDPCSLLDDVRAEDHPRFGLLAQDNDGQGGRVNDDSLCEARVALTLEYRGILDGPLQRPQWGEALDVHGLAWDFKQPHSEAAIYHRAAERAAKAGDPAPTYVNTANAYSLAVELQRIREKQSLGFGVVVDLRRLEPTQADELLAAAYADATIDLDRLRAFPQDLSPFQEGA